MVVRFLLPNLFSESRAILRNLAIRGEIDGAREDPGVAVIIELNDGWCGRSVGVIIVEFEWPIKYYRRIY